MSRLATLKTATSLSDVATLLDFKPKAVSYILYKRPAATKYTTFQIPKRNGGQRTIKAPIAALKLLQRKLSEDVYKRQVEWDAKRRSWRETKRDASATLGMTPNNKHAAATGCGKQRGIPPLRCAPVGMTPEQ